jgi:low temperature requirement protein LtrA
MAKKNKKEKVEHLYFSKFQITIASIIMILVGLGMLLGSFYEKSPDREILFVIGVIFFIAAMLIYKYGQKYPMYEIRR